MEMAGAIGAFPASAALWFGALHLFQSKSWVREQMTEERVDRE